MTFDQHADFTTFLKHQEDNPKEPILWDVEKKFYKYENQSKGFWVFTFYIEDGMGNRQCSWTIHSDKEIKKFSDKTASKHHPMFYKE
jgi:retron-type reverse transcriptase